MAQPHLVDWPRMAMPYPASPDKLCSTKSRPSSTFRFMQMSLSWSRAYPSLTFTFVFSSFLTITRRALQGNPRDIIIPYRIPGRIHLIVRKGNVGFPQDPCFSTSRPVSASSRPAPAYEFSFSKQTLFRCHFIRRVT